MRRRIEIIELFQKHIGIKGYKMKKKFKVLLVMGSFCIIAAAILMILWLWYIQLKTNKQLKESVTFELEEIQSYMAQAQKEKIALLAAKFGVPEPHLVTLLDEYRTKHDVIYRLRKNVSGERQTAEIKKSDRNVDLNFDQTLTDLSNRYGIPKEKIADILIDYKTMGALEKGNIIENIITGGTKSSLVKFSIKELLGFLR